MERARVFCHGPVHHKKKMFDSVRLGQIRFGYVFFLTAKSATTKNPRAGMEPRPEQNNAHLRFLGIVVGPKDSINCSFVFLA